MNYSMVEYVINLTSKHIYKLKIGNKDEKVDLYNIDKQNTLVINGTELDIRYYNYIECDIEWDDNDLLILRFYTYNDGGDAGMILDCETKIRTNLSKLEEIMVL